MEIEFEYTLDTGEIITIIARRVGLYDHFELGFIIPPSVDEVHTLNKIKANIEEIQQLAQIRLTDKEEQTSDRYCGESRWN